MSNIATVPSHVAGDTFTASMWSNLQGNINDGIVNQVCAVRVYNTANFATTTTFQPITFNTERYDGDNMHSTTTNTSQLVCNTAGVYSIGGNVEFPPDAATARAHLGIRLNGSTIIAQTSTTLFLSYNHFINVGCDFLLAQNDYVELVVASGSSLTVQADSDVSPEFWMHRV